MCSTLACLNGARAMSHPPMGLIGVTLSRDFVCSSLRKTHAFSYFKISRMLKREYEEMISRSTGPHQTP